MTNPDAFDGEVEAVDGDDIVVNVAGADEGGDFIVPAGWYEAHVTSIEPHVGKESGEPGLKWTLKLGPDAKNLRLYNYTSFSKKALFKLIQTAEALGFPRDGDQVKIKRSEAIGRRCMVKLIVGQWDGKPRMELKELKVHKDGPIDSSAAPF
jgi:hypothetical protein